MIVSIHQPQYMPWLPYFSKIASADTFVFLDKVQFQKNGLHNRNELKNSNGRFWLTIPVSANLGDKLNDVKISDQRWSKKHIKSIKINYGKSGYIDFEKRRDFNKTIFSTFGNLIFIILILLKNTKYFFPISLVFFHVFKSII